MHWALKLWWPMVVPVAEIVMVLIAWAWPDRERPPPGVPERTEST